MANLFIRLGQTLGELRRRHVFRVLGLYAIAAWGVLQVADIILPALMVPDWVMSLLVIAMVFGFPLTALLAWIYDITPDGVVRTPGQRNETNPDRTEFNWRWVDFSIIAALLAVLAFVLMTDVDLMGPEQPLQPERSIAVLPFTDLSPEQDTGYFCDGMAEAILDALASLSGLQVAARTSSFAFRDRQNDIRELARALGVATLLEGSVRKDGNRLRISARLVDGRTGHQLWSETYDRMLEDVFTVQDSISRAIVDVLRVRVLEGGTLVEAPTYNQLAYEEYLRGRDQLRSGNSVDDIQAAIERFERALEMDPSFGLARAGICTGYWQQYQMVGDSELADQAITACRQAEATSDRAETLVALGNVYRETGRVAESQDLFRRALEAEPNSASAHAGLAQSLRMEGDSEAAEFHLRRAIQLDPAYWRHRFALARVVYEQGRVEETVDQLNQAIRLAPDNPVPYVSLAAIHYYEGDYLRAAEINRQSLERNPTPRAYSNAGSYYFYAGEYAQAEAMFRRALELFSPGDFRWHGFLAEALEMQPDKDPQEIAVQYELAIRLGYERLAVNPADHGARSLIASYLAKTGQALEAEAELERLDSTADLDMLAHRAAGFAYLALERPEQAIDQFEAAVATGLPRQIFADDPRLQPLTQDPRFTALISVPAEPTTDP
jgi:TolB-like protein/Flp pilus assembly protein TadD